MFWCVYVCWCAGSYDACKISECPCEVWVYYLLTVVRGGYLVFYYARSVLRVGDLQVMGAGGVRCRAGMGVNHGQRRRRDGMRFSFRLEGEGVCRLPPC